MTHTTPLLGGKELVDAIVDQALGKKAENIVVIDLHDANAPADWFVVCQGENAVHNRAIRDGVEEGTTELGLRPWRSEGMQQGRWVVIDYVDVVVHIMLPELRKLYALESLWQETRRVRVETR